MNKSIFISRLNKIRELNSKLECFVNKDLYKLLAKEEVLVAGYENIKSHQGLHNIVVPVSSSFTQEESLDAWKVSRIRKLSAALRNESWTPLPARRIYTPKPGKIQTSLLGIQFLEEQVVESVLSLLLDAVYDPTFSPNSFGFRRYRGVHDALKTIVEKYDGMRFAIQLDIKLLFDNVNHHILIEILKKRIQDDRLIRLIWKLLRAGYMDENRKIDLQPATFQASIVSPSLTNIYLHEFDVFMDKICQGVEKRSPYVDTYKAELCHKLSIPSNLIESRVGRLKRTLKDGTVQENRDQYICELQSLKKSYKNRINCKPSDRIVYTRSTLR